ncbi:NEAT domain-containing protein [Paenibacillus tianmuensis]|uniref:NEAT domain-containing protein n=1 Tax=Paenibacillus tianmuensis TaxID=624147 RepID=UPI001430D1D1|nr:NEAT domain-containing protein [Paenibacillus tianmuensis]
MSRTLQKALSVFLTVFVFLAAVQIPLVGAAPSLEEGSYTIGFTVLKEDKDEPSMVNDYLPKPVQAKLEVKDGKQFASITLLNSSWWQYFRTENNEQFVDAEVVSRDEIKNTRVVKFEVPDVSAKLNAKIHVKIMGLPGMSNFVYDNYYTVRIVFDTDTLVAEPGDKSGLKALVAQAQSAHDAAVEGSLKGQYPAGSKSKLSSAIAQAKAVADSASPAHVQLNKAAAALQAALDAFKASVHTANPDPTKDGVYRLPFTALHATADQTSGMDSYLAKPGKLTVQQGRKKVSFTVKQSSIIPQFKVEQGSVLLDATVVSRNAADDTRVVEFEVSDLNALVNAEVRVETSYNGQPYQRTHKIRLKFDSANAEKIPSSELTGPAAVKAGQQLKLTFGVSGVTNSVYEQVYTQELTLGFDPGKLALVEASPLINGLRLTEQYEIAPGQVRLSTSLDEGVQPLPVNNRYITLTFQAQSVTQATYALVALSDVIVNNHNGQLKVDDSWHMLAIQAGPAQKGKLNALISEAEALHNAAVEGTFPGQYANGAKNALYAAIRQAQAAAGLDEAEQGQVDQAASALEAAIAGFKAAIVTSPRSPVNVANGQYSFDLVVISGDRFGSSVSSYLEHTGKLTVQDRKKFLSFQRKNGVTIANFQLLRADGTTQDIPAQEAPTSRESEAARTLAAGAADVRYEIDDVTATYLVKLAVAKDTGTEERSFRIALSNLVPASPGGPGPANPNTPAKSPNGLADGTYSIDFKVLKYGTDNKSVMQDYVKTPGSLKVENGTQYVSIVLKQSKEITEFKVEQGGSLTDTTVVSTDEKENTRIVKFQVPNLDEKVKGWVKVDWAAFNYFHSYDVHIAFDKSSMKELNGNLFKVLNAKPFPESLKAGEYTMDYALLDTEASSEQTKTEDNKADKKADKNAPKKSFINDLVKHPANLTVQEDGKKLVTFTVNKSKEMPMIQVQQDQVEKDADPFADVKVVSSNEQENTRVVQFEVKDAGTRKARIKMDWPDKYNRVYTVDMTFDLDSIKAIKKEEEKRKKEESKAEAKPAVEAIAPAKLTDIEDHWAKALIERAAALGIVNGYEDGTFRPDNETSRAEVATMVSRTLKLKGKQGELNFADLDSIPAWAKENLASIVSSGIISGYADGTFSGDRKVSRTEIAVMIVRALRIEPVANASLPFTDARQIAAWAQPYIDAAHKLDIIGASYDNHFAPHANVTRVEAVNLVLKMLNHVK